MLKKLLNQLKNALNGITATDPKEAAFIEELKVAIKQGDQQKIQEISENMTAEQEALLLESAKNHEQSVVYARLFTYLYIILKGLLVFYVFQSIFNNKNYILLAIWLTLDMYITSKLPKNYRLISAIASYLPVVLYVLTYQ